MSEVAVIIPARMESSRFPGKPLAKLLGREMILHVLDRVTDVVSGEITYVATDSLDVAHLVEKSGFQVVMTGDHPTGTDRLAEANRVINAPYVLNIQGDEPAFNPADITASIACQGNLGSGPQDRRSTRTFRTSNCGRYCKTSPYNIDSRTR